MMEKEQRSMLPPERRPAEKLSPGICVLLFLGVILFHFLLGALFKSKPLPRVSKASDSRIASYCIPGSKEADLLTKAFEPSDDPKLFIQTPDKFGYGRFRLISGESTAIRTKPDLSSFAVKRKTTSSEKMNKKQFLPLRPVVEDADLPEDPEKIVEFPFWSSMDQEKASLPFPISREMREALFRMPPSRTTVLRIERPLLEDLPWEARVVASCGQTQWDALALRILNQALAGERTTPVLRQDGSLLQVVWTPLKVLNAKKSYSSGETFHP